MHFAAGAHLTAGQMNDVAHSGIQLIEQKTLTADATSVTFSDIPQQYQTLWMVLSAGVNDTTTRVAVARFNGDNGTNYVSHRMQHLGDGTSSTDFIDPSDFVAIGIINTNLLAQNSILFPGYSRTDRNKSVLSTFAAPSTPSEGSTGSSLGFCGGMWNSTSAVTDIEIIEQPTGGAEAILAGSIFALYGLGTTT